MRRRQFVALTGGIGITGFAGCAEDSGGEADAQATAEDNDDSDSTEQTTTEPTEEPTPTGTPEQSAEAERNAVGYPSEYIEVRDVSYNQPADEYSGPTVSGIVDNVAGQELSYVEVQVQAFNENDTQIGEALDNTQNLREGKSWQFEAEFWDTEDSEIAYWMGRAEVSNY